MIVEIDKEDLVRMISGITYFPECNIMIPYIQKGFIDGESCNDLKWRTTMLSMLDEDYLWNLYKELKSITKL